jgi:hypothetical protein
MKKFLAIIFILITYINILNAQELRCNIQVSSQQVQGTNKKVYQTLQTALYEFMNNRAWTNHVYTVNERIVCNILITVQEQLSADEFRATLQIQSNRPIYNSSYSSVMLNYKDDNFTFRYVEFEALEFNETTHKSNLTSVLAYYAFLILGFDYDSFSLEGGTEFFTKAEKVVSNAQNSSDKGWKPYDGKNNKNRYWLIKNILDKRYEPLREFNYRFHRLGLDLMDSKPNEGRTEITEDLLLLQKVYREKPDPFMVYYHVLFDAKADEFVNIYSDALPDEKNRAFQILNEIDNANSAKYKKITGQQ